MMERKILQTPHKQRLLTCYAFVCLLFLPLKTYAQLGMDCVNAETIDANALPFQSGLQTTCGSGDEYDETQVNCTDANFYLNGEDYVYTFTPILSNCYSFDLENADAWMGLFVLDGCPDNAATNCIANINDAIDPILVSADLTGGNTYYIIVSRNPNGVVPPSGECGNYELNVKSIEPLQTPQIICVDATYSSINFDWQDIVGVNAYQVEVSINGGAFYIDHLASSDLEVIGLYPNDEVFVRVIAFGVASCSNSEAGTTTCTAADCPDINLEINNLASEYCIDDVPVNLETIPSGGVLSGPGIIDNTFNPSILEEGVYTVVYEYTDPSSTCDYATSVDVSILSVLETPVVTCSTTTDNSIIFSWTEVTGSTFYLLTLSGVIFDQLDRQETFYEFPGLPQGGEITISVVAIAEQFCANSEAGTATCFIDPCESNPLGNMSIDNLNSQYCKDDEPFELQGTPPGGTFSGTGVINNVFYPSKVGEWWTNITYEFFDEPTGCLGQVTASTEILAPFADPIVVCSESTNSSVTFEWNNVGLSEYQLTYSIDGEMDITVTEIGTSYTISDLNMGSEVEISVFGLVETICGNSEIGSGYCIASPMVAGGVWPGDANSDGVANNFDLLPIGIGMDSTGNARINPTLDWIGQAADDWTNSFADGINYKYADCNGDGTINSADTVAIVQNYGKNHAKKGGKKGGASDMPLYVELSEESLNNGDPLIAPIILGTSDIPAAEVYGIAFTINFNDKLLNPESVALNFEECWLGTEGENLITLSKSFAEDGFIDMAITRIDLQNQTNYGTIGTLTGIIDNIGGKKIGQQDLVVTISNIRAISADETELPVFSTSNSIVITDINSKTLNTSIEVFPIPSKNTLSLRVPDLQKIRSLQLYNLVGGLEKNWTGEELPLQNALQLEVSKLQSGMYFLVVDYDGVLVSRKVVLKE